MVLRKKTSDTNTGEKVEKNKTPAHQEWNCKLELKFKDFLTK